MFSIEPSYQDTRDHEELAIRVQIAFRDLQSVTVYPSGSGFFNWSIDPKNDPKLGIVRQIITPETIKVINTIYWKDALIMFNFAKTLDVQKVAEGRLKAFLYWGINPRIRSAFDDEKILERIEALRLEQNP